MTSWKSATDARDESGGLIDMVSDTQILTAYKMLAEKEAIRFANENGLNLTVIRPVWVYGPREFHAGPYEFCKSLTNGCRILPMGKNNKFHVIYVKDLVKAIMLAMMKAPRMTVK